MSRLRRKNVDANNGSFSLDENDDTQDVTSVTDECDVAQAHKNFVRPKIFLVPKLFFKTKKKFGTIV